MKKTVLLALGFVAIAFTSCKKNSDDDSPAPSYKLTITTQGSYRDLTVNQTDTIEVLIEATGKDYTIEFLGEKRISYPGYDSTMSLCNDFTYHAFYLLDNNSSVLTVVDKSKITKQVVFAPQSFTFSKSNIIMNCSGNECVPNMTCETQNSDGVGSYRSLLQFKVDGVVRTVEVSAKSEAGAPVVIEEPVIKEPIVEGPGTGGTPILIKK